MDKKHMPNAQAALVTYATEMALALGHAHRTLRQVHTPEFINGESNIHAHTTLDRMAGMQRALEIFVECHRDGKDEADILRRLLEHYRLQVTDVETQVWRVEQYDVSPREEDVARARMFTLQDLIYELIEILVGDTPLSGSLSTVDSEGGDACRPS